MRIILKEKKTLKEKYYKQPLFHVDQIYRKERKEKKCMKGYLFSPTSLYL